MARQTLPNPQVQPRGHDSGDRMNFPFWYVLYLLFVDFKLKKVLHPPLGNFADISYLKDNSKLRVLRDVCTLYSSGALECGSLLHMLLQ